MKIFALNLNIRMKPGATSNHCHDFWQLDYYTNLETKILAKVDGRTHFLDDSCALLIPPGCYHEISNTSACKISAVKFMPDENKDFADLIAQPISIAEYGDLLQRLFHEESADDSLCQKMREHYLDILLLRYLRNSRRGGDSNFCDSRLNESLLYMKRHITADLKLEKLAERSGMSVNHFIRCFKKEMGMTPMRYMRKLVIKKAVEMLSYADLSLSEVADHLGFPDQHCFSRAFRRETNLPPGAYRRLQREPTQDNLKR
ncbi:MAG: AraC family transcriptional regulator [Lentisphaerae bacterium]|nr:AraC family transcriptional regulator [Lentisphaerota bacterium]MCP4102292.1 AraC family transcriptional regulator [Lentisphaerota bacterium]